MSFEPTMNLRFVPVPNPSHGVPYVGATTGGPGPMMAFELQQMWVDGSQLPEWRPIDVWTNPFHGPRS